MKFTFNVKYIWSFWKPRGCVDVLYEGIEVIERATPEDIAKLFTTTDVLMVQVQGRIYGRHCGSWNDRYVGELQEYLAPYRSEESTDWEDSQLAY